MKRNIRNFITIILIAILIAAYIINVKIAERNKNFLIWSEKYEYQEFYEPDVMIFYRITLIDKRTALVQVIGFQTYIDAEVKIKYDESSMEFYFDELKEGYSQIQKGELLFTLYQEEEGLVTQWARIEAIAVYSGNQRGQYFEAVEQFTWGISALDDEDYT